MRTAEEVASGAYTLAKTCGCAITTPTRTSGSRVVSRCDEADALWSELVEARDEVRAGERRGEKAGKKRRIDAFAAAREAFHAHVFGEVA